jgi:hypothetical protein
MICAVRKKLNMVNSFFEHFVFLSLYAVFEVAFCDLGQSEFRKLSLYVICLFWGVHMLNLFIEYSVA